MGAFLLKIPQKRLKCAFPPICTQVLFACICPTCIFVLLRLYYVRAATIGQEHPQRAHKKSAKVIQKQTFAGIVNSKIILYMVHLIKLPEKQPDCCAICPLLGLIPKDRVPAKSYEKLVCLGTNEAMTQRASRIRASQRNSKHPLHRYCDNKWRFWMQLKNRCLGINSTMYLQCRIPYEQSQQMTFNFIKFHRQTKTEE